MKRSSTPVLLSAALLLCFSCIVLAYPRPSAYPVSWELRFEHGEPKRILVKPAGGDVPEAYWYMTYTVTNPSQDVLKFMPNVELMTEDGKLIRSDSQIPAAVYEAIRNRERNKHLLPPLQIAGELRVGEAQAKDGVVVWKEPTPEMGQFSIFVTGLSGEGVILKDDKGNDVEREKNGVKEKVVLWKTLQITYLMVGDEKFPGIDKIEKVSEEWIMR